MTAEIEIIKDARDLIQKPVDTLEAMQQGEALFQKRLTLALSATTNCDWTDQGEKPYMCATGAKKIAARFGLILKIVEVERENITDENGDYYVYSAKVIVQWPSTGGIVEDFGECSSRDAFFSKGGKLKAHEVDISNIKKAAITNAYGRAILGVLGLGGLEWSDLEAYGITKNGKTKINYKGAGAKAAETKVAAKAESDSTMPYWMSDYNGTTYLHAKEGFHFTPDYLMALGFKASKKAGTWHMNYNSDVEAALKDEYAAAESVKATEGGL